MDILKHKLLKEVYSVIGNTNLGTHNFKKVRRNLLKRLVKDILDLKLDLKSFYLFNNYHLDKLVAYWIDSGNSTSTIMNKKAITAWFLKKLQVDIALKTNENLGLKKLRRPKDFIYISENLRNNIYHPITLTILDFQLYFGLTKNESIKLDLTDAYKNTHELYINKLLSFNSNERWINIVTDKQKQTIKNRLEFLGNKNTLLKFMSHERIINLYNNELAYNNISAKTDLRKYFLQNTIIRYQNNGVSKKETYQKLMIRTGFKDIKNLIKVAYS